MIRFALLLSFFLSLVALPVLASDGGPPPPDAAPLVTGAPSIDDAPLQFAAQLVTLAQQGRWGALVALGLFALVWAVRKFASKLPDGGVKTALLSTWGGWVLNLLLSLAAGFSTALLAGVPLTALSVVGIVGGALTYALAAAGLVELKKDATAKGDAAAREVSSKAAAVDLLEKGPLP